MAAGHSQVTRINLSNICSQVDDIIYSTEVKHIMFEPYNDGEPIEPGAYECLREIMKKGIFKRISIPYRYPQEFYIELAKGLVSNKHILEIYQCGLNVEQFKPIAQALTENKSVKRITGIYNEKSLEHLGRALTVNNTLQYLYVKNLVDLEGINYLSEGLLENTNLRELEVYAGNPRVRTVAPLSNVDNLTKMLLNNKSLIRLSLYNVTMKSSSIFQVVEASVNLESLTISHNIVAIKDLIDIAHVLEDNYNLTTVKLSLSVEGDLKAVAAAFEEVIKNNRTIKHLVLPEKLKDYDDLFAKAIVEHNYTLESLSYGSTHLFRQIDLASDSVLREDLRLNRERRMTSLGALAARAVRMNQLSTSPLTRITKEYYGLQ